MSELVGGDLAEAGPRGGAGQLVAEHVFGDSATLVGEQEIGEPAGAGVAHRPAGGRLPWTGVDDADAQARAGQRCSCLSIIAEPLSIYSESGMPRAVRPLRSAASSRTVSSRRAHRYPVSTRLWSSMKANRMALRPATVGPCSASPVQRSFGASASNRPNACGGNPFGRVFSSRRTKCERTASALRANTRSQPRTVDTGRPSRAAIGRCPAPVALARNATPITSTPSARRSRHDTASSTCVTRHEPHRARRGRRSPTPRTERCRACPHGLRPPPHGQTSSPANRRRSTSSASLPTMTTGALQRTKQRPPPVRPRSGEGRCAFQNVIRLSSHTKKGHPKAALVTIIATSAAPPPPHRQAWCRSTLVGRWWCLFLRWCPVLRQRRGAELLRGQPGRLDCRGQRRYRLLDPVLLGRYLRLRLTCRTVLRWRGRPALLRRSRGRLAGPDRRRRRILDPLDRRGCVLLRRCRLCRRRNVGQ